MNYESLKKTTQTLLSRNLSILVSGAPGIGKTALAREVAQDLGWRLVVSHPVIDDPVDYKGLPFLKPDGNADFVPFGTLRDLMQTSEDTLWFVDDLIQAPTGVQAALMQLVHPQGRELNGCKLSPHVRILACTNRRKDKAGGTGFIEPLKQRFIPLTLDVDAKSWTDWAIGTGLNPMVISYIRWRPGNLIVEDPSPDLTGSANPRSWHFASEILDSGLGDGEAAETLKGVLGQAVGTEFVSFAKVADKLPDLDRIGLFPETVEVPTDPAVCFALAGALTAMDSFPAENVMTYVSRMKREYQVLFAKLANGRKAEISKSGPFADWVIKNQRRLGLN